MTPHIGSQRFSTTWPGSRAQFYFAGSRDHALRGWPRGCGKLWGLGMAMT